MSAGDATGTVVVVVGATVELLVAGVVDTGAAVTVDEVAGLLATVEAGPAAAGATVATTGFTADGATVVAAAATDVVLAGTVAVTAAVVVGAAVVVVVAAGTPPDGDSFHSTYDQHSVVQPGMIANGAPPSKDTEFDLPAQPVTRTLSSESTATP